MQSEDDIRAFVFAFRTIAGTLSTLKTFSKFDWADLAPALDEDEYADYKSWYLYYYDKHRGGGGETTVLADIDFKLTVEPLKMYEKIIEFMLERMMGD